MTQVMHCWIVELWERGAWRPTWGVSRTRREAQDDLASWREYHPHDCFRIRKYVRLLTRQECA